MTHVHAGQHQATDGVLRIANNIRDDHAFILLLFQDCAVQEGTYRRLVEVRAG